MNIDQTIKFYIKLQQSFLSSCFNSILLSIVPLYISLLTADPHSIVPNQHKYNQQQLVQCYLIPSFPLYYIYSTIGTKLLLSNLHEIAFENMQHKNSRITSTTTSTCVAKCTPLVVIQYWTSLFPLLPAHSPILIPPLYIYVTL